MRTGLDGAQSPLGARRTSHRQGPVPRNVSASRQCFPILRTESRLSRLLYQPWSIKKTERVKRATGKKKRAFLSIGEELVGPGAIFGVDPYAFSACQKSKRYAIGGGGSCKTNECARGGVNRLILALTISTHDQTDRKPLSDPLAASDGQHLQRYLRPRQTKALITAFHANRRRSR